ncbi:MAG: DNA polymerase I [Chloroflexi bacterium]|nr:DNA polymerase I [Chloroflexota bacterium]
MKPRILLFDANALIHRAFHAIPTPFTVSKTGEIVTAVYGFSQMFIKALTDLKPKYAACAFDAPARTFRHIQFEAYKQNRPRMADELAAQFPRVRQIVEAFNVPIFMLEGYEADDLLGSLARQAAAHDLEAVIVTGDADAMQLVNPDVRVFTPGKTFSEVKLYDEEAVLLKYGVRPAQIADFKGLVGDPSDNIPGVRGIGEKTAVRLLTEFGSVEEVYHHLDRVAPPKTQELLAQQKDKALQSKQLATIDTSAPVTLDLEACRLSDYDRNKVVALFRELEFASLLKRLPSIEEEGVVAPEVTVTGVQGNYSAITTEDKLQELGTRLTDTPYLVIDVETSDKDPLSASLAGIALSCRPGEAFYIPVGHQGLDSMLQLPRDRVIGWLGGILSNNDLKRIAHNGKFDMNVLSRCGLELPGWDFDTSIAAHLLNEKSITLRDLAFKRLGLEMMPINDLIGTGARQISMASLPFEKVAQYACADADVTARLYPLLENELKTGGLWQLFDEVETPLVGVLSRMERTGIVLDQGVMRDLAQKLGEQIRNLEGEIYRCAGHEFNINSPQQLANILFVDLKLEAKRRTMKGYSTDASVLEELRGVHEIIDHILTYRQLAKLKSTYIDALPAMVNRETGRLHTTFNQTSVATGRLSSSDPNLQNIPIKGDLGRQIRTAFKAQAGWWLLSADYSQIDLRVLAHLSQDTRLVDAFRQDEDIHAATAHEIFGVPLDKVTSDMRRLAKTVNFGVIYGMSEYGLEQATDLSRQEAGQFIQRYFEKYKGVAAYLDATRKHVRDKGYVQTILGRRRYIPEIQSFNRQLREAAERMAINMPVQGTSADIIKVAMVRLQRAMEEMRVKSRMLLQVHDDLLLEIPPDELEQMKALILEIMPHAIELTVPVKVDIKVGRNWGEMNA